MRVFITGATGVLGRWVVRLLVEAGEVVRGLSRSQENASTLRAIGAEPVEADLFRRESLYGAMKDCDAVLHLATKIPPFGRFRSREAWEQNDRIRRDGTRNLVDAALESGVTTLVYPSVCFLYPDSGANWIDSEKTTPEPHAMLLSTLEAEEQIRRFAATGCRGVSLRMGAFYGPESAQSQQQLRFARWGFAATFGVEHAYHSMIWISDSARAVVAALRRAPSGIYDVVDDEPLQNRET
jgi:nucleoside-diphosphate-sugar epimerase